LSSKIEDLLLEEDFLIDFVDHKFILNFSVLY
jgi:hypothetical protein